MSNQQPSTIKARSIGDICNDDQGLYIGRIEGRFYWYIGSDSHPIDNEEIGRYCQEIPEYLFDALCRFEDEADRFPPEAIANV